MTKKLLRCFIAILLFSGCAMQIKTLSDPKSDFSAYKSFCWMNGCEFAVTGPSYLNDSLIRENIKKSIVTELNDKGLVLDSNNPDLLVSFNITIRNQQAIVYPLQDDDQFFHPLERDPKLINYLEGTMMIGMADKKESRVVWESFANRYMDIHPDLTEKNISKGIHRILKKFPPRN